MTTVVPSAPPGPRAIPSSGDGAHVRRNPGDSDFAAALSETAGDVADEAVGEESAGHTREVRRPHHTAVHRLDVRARRAAAAGDKSDAETRTDTLAEKTDVRAAGARDITISLVEERAPSQEAAQPATAGDQLRTEVAQVPQATPQRGDAARDALAVLGTDMMTKRDAAAPSAEVIAQSRRQAPVGARSTDTVSGEPEKSDSPGLHGDAPDIGAIPIRVLRQETHFQPIAHEARRLLGMTAGAADERALPLSLAAAARINRPQALQQHSKEAPATPDGIADAAELLSPAALALSPTAADGAAPVSVGQQIADGVQRALESSTEPTAPRSVPGADPTASVFAPTLRTIKLQLNPHSLGMVTVVLTGSDGDLRIHLEAERAETFGKVEQERGVLSSRLNGAGYGITEVTVGRSAAADTQNRDGDQRESAARHGSQSGSPHGDTAGGGARQSAEQFADQRARREAGDHASRAHGAPAASIAKGAANSAPLAGLSYAGRFRPV